MESLQAFVVTLVPSLLAAAVVFAFDDAALRGLRRRRESFDA